MSSKKIEFDGIQLTVPDSWYDITDEIETADKPYTLAEPERGVGALQFSPAVYQGGVVPNPSEGDLRNMLLRFRQQRGLGEAFDGSTFAKKPLVGAGMSFHSGEDFIRVWYVSDGRNLALITYVCAWGKQERELALCEEIVKSLRFLPTS
jgi:hypothetical protein